MNYDLFKRLVEDGEKTTVDFKILCGAFETTNPRNDEEKAELLKDICAMANNGSATSYILVGVADSGRDFRSVTNAHLTGDNVQRLIQEYLRPIPRVRVHSCLWGNCDRRHRGKRFVVLQVGPNAGAAFQFARDLIDWKKHLCFRRNEVWVRNDATTDIATPDQILRLLGKKPPNDALELDQNTEYFKAPREQQRKLVSDDVSAFFNDIGARVLRAPPNYPGAAGGIVYSDDSRVLLRIRRKDFLFRFVVRREFAEKYSHSYEISQCWGLEHGILVFPLAEPVKTSFGTPRVHYKQSWGWFTVYGFGYWWPRVLRYSDEKRKDISVPIMTMRCAQDTARLRRELTSLLEFIESDDITFHQLDVSRRAINQFLRYRDERAEVERAELRGDELQAANNALRQMRTIRSLLSTRRL